MRGSTRRISTRLAKLCSRRLCVLPAAGLVAAALCPSPAVSQENRSLENHILGIGNCPPWNPQSPEVCKHSLEKVVKFLAPRLDTEPDQTHLLINEGASALALKRKATELANRLGPEDRLIIYANLPLGRPDADAAADDNGYVLELWAAEKPETAAAAISSGTWISAPAFAAMIHTIPAAEVILILDTNNSHAVDQHLLDQHSVDMKNRPEALVSSSGTGQTANYSADRTISLFAKHLALALKETDGTLLDAMSVAVNGTRQAAIPICAKLKETGSQTGSDAADCNQVPEIQDPDELLSRTMLLPLSESQLN